jgi:hypothetical protein
MKLSINQKRGIYLSSKIKALHIFRYLCCALLLVINFGVMPVSADIAVDDDFNSSSIDTAWDISFFNMKKGEKDWKYLLDRSNLVVKKIKDRGHDIQWSAVILSQTFDPLTDFNVDIDFSWDITHGNRKKRNAVQRFYVNLYDTGNSLISSVGYKDTSINRTGNKVVLLRDGSFTAKAHGSNGKESINLLRNGNALEVYWNDENVLSGTSSGDLGRIDVLFTYSKKRHQGVSSYFGTESVDSIRVSAPVVPEPVSSVLFIVGGAFLAGRLYCKRNRKH